MFAMLGVMNPLVLLFVICLPVFFGFLAFWIWMLISAIQNPGLKEGEKIGWVLAIIFLHLLGALPYLFIGHPKRHGPPQ